MKKYLTLLSLAILMACSDNNDTSNAESNDGREGSTATFILKNNYMYVVDQDNLNVFSLINPENPVKCKPPRVLMGKNTLRKSSLKSSG